MSLALPLLAALSLAAADPAEARARWSASPAEVELGAPFELSLEIEHEPGLALREVVPAELALDASWVVLGAEPPASTPGAGGTVRTRCVWRVASLEPGDRALSEALASVALGEGVARIELGDSSVRVLGVLAEGEDAPRPMREFPDDFAADAATPGSTSALWIALAIAGAMLALAAALVRRLRARRRVAAAPPGPLERLRALEARLAEPDGCYALTGLLREAGDALRRRSRGALTDEEWLAEAHASLEIPRNVVAELAEVFQRAARVKYAGETPTPWAVEETATRARRALESLGAGGTRA